MSTTNSAVHIAAPSGDARWYRNPQKLMLIAVPAVVVLWSINIWITLFSRYSFAWATTVEFASWAIYGTLTLICVCLAPWFPRTALAVLFAVLALEATQIPAIQRGWSRGFIDLADGLPPLQPLSFGLSAMLWVGIVLFLIALSPRSADLPLWLLLVVTFLVSALANLPNALIHTSSGWTLLWPFEVHKENVWMGTWPHPTVLLMLFVVLTLLGWMLRTAWIAEFARRTQDARAAREQILGARAQQSLAEERQRIAGEVHDTLAHSLTVVLAQAEGALRAGDAERSDSLGNIASVSRAALRDVRALIERLDVGGPLHGLARLSELPALIDGVRGAGLDVELEQNGCQLALEDAAESAAYRIVQEALTNVLKHGDRSQPVWVHLESTRAGGLHDDHSVDSELRIRVTSALRPRDEEEQDLQSPALGRGLEGMRLRAELVGGSCLSGSDGEVWTVEAIIPTAHHGTRRTREASVAA